MGRGLGTCNMQHAFSTWARPLNLKDCSLRLLKASGFQFLISNLCKRAAANPVKHRHLDQHQHHHEHLDLECPTCAIFNLATLPGKAHQ